MTFDFKGQDHSADHLNQHIKKGIVLYGIDFNMYTHTNKLEKQSVTMTFKGTRSRVRYSTNNLKSPSLNSVATTCYT